MGKIFYLMGKSASGKDTLYKQLLGQHPEMGTVVLYTTRPKREGETDGVEYHFTSPDVLEEFEKNGKIIEQRTYQTAFGPWSYATVDDGQICLEQKNYLVIGTLESYEGMRKYFGAEAMVPLYIYVDDGVRLMRALERERAQKKPKYQELCRRFLADEADFSEEKLRAAGIGHGFENENMELCLKAINRAIERNGESHRDLSVG